MTTLFPRYEYNFDSSRFGEASNLTPQAANTLNLLANNTGTFTDWQVTDLAAGAIDRTDYFKNPTSNSTVKIETGAAVIAVNSLACANANAIFVQVFEAANNLILSVNAFKSHTDNISGIVVVTDPSVPSYESASGVGQMSMLTLTKTDGAQSNTVPILGSFTSLFINDVLESNGNQMLVYASQLANSISSADDGFGNLIYTSNLSSTQISSIQSYANSTSSILNTRRTHDWNFFQNSMQIMKDAAFLQQFTNMGATNTYLIRNVVGTNSLINKLDSQ